MSQNDVDDFDNIDFLENENDMDFTVVKDERIRRSFNARRELERRMEIKRLRELIDYFDLNDFK